jgi:hypothetical protein
MNKPEGVMTMCASAINRDEFSAGLLNGSDWVFGPGELRGADDQGAYEGGEVRSEDLREAAARPTSGLLTGAIAALLSLATGFLFTFMVNDITGKSHQWLFWPVAGLYFAIWIAEQQTSGK